MDDATPTDPHGPANEAAYRRLVETLASQSIIVLVGSGLSVRLGYPTWTGLLDALQKEAKLAAPAQTQHLDEVALSKDLYLKGQEYKRVLPPGLFGELIRGLFGPRSPLCDEAHRLLVTLPFRHVFTTNYDHSISAAYREVHGSDAGCIRLENFAASMPFMERFAGNAAYHIVHLHGSVDAPDEIVLTLEDYNRLYKTSVQCQHFFRVCYTAFPMMFIGFGLADEDVMDRIRDVGIFGSGDPRHFAIIESRGIENLNTKRNDLRSRYRVEPVFYANERGDHAELLVLLRRLIADVRERQEAIRRSFQAGLASPSSGLQAGTVPIHPPPPGPIVKGIDGAVVPGTPSEAAGEEAKTEVDADITAISKFIAPSLPDTAITQYRAILARPELSDRLKYRLHANIGYAQYAKGDRDLASQSLLTAASLYQGTKDARAIRLFGLFLAERDDEAATLADELCREDPLLERAQSLRIRLSPESTPFDAVEQSVPEQLRSSPEVAAALAECAALRRQPSTQQKYLRIAMDAAPTWVDPVAVLGTALISAGRESATFSMDRGWAPRDLAAMTDADALFTRAIGMTSAAGHTRMVAGLHLNRSVARKMLGRADDSRADLRTAYGMDSTVLEIAVAEAAAREMEGDRDGAIACLEPFAQVKDPRSTFLLAQYLHERGRRDEQTRAFEILLPWIADIGRVEQAELRSDFFTLAIQLARALGRLPEVQAEVDRIPEDMIALSSRFALQAKTALAKGDEDAATVSAEQALKALNADSNFFDRLEVGSLLSTLRLWPLAFTVWKELACPDQFGKETLEFLRVAHFAGEDGAALAFCRAMRNAGVHERDCYRNEADILDRSHEPDAAMEILQKWLAIQPDDADTRLDLSVFALRAGKLDLVESDPARLPSVSSVSDPKVGATVAHVLRSGSNPMAGVTYAYDLWRRFPDSDIARFALIASQMNPEAMPVSLTQPTQVDETSAVWVQEESGLQRWVVVEPGENPSVSRDEFPPNHPLVAALMGKRSGESYSVNGRAGRVLALEHRVVFRTKQCLTTFETLFPDNPYLRSFAPPVGEAKDAGDPKAVLGELWDDLQKRENYRRRLEVRHSQQRLPIAMIAKRLGRPVFETIRHFAGQDHLVVHSSVGLPEEWNGGVEHLSFGTTLVLDGTVVGTLFMLGMHKRLAALPFKLIVPQSVLDEIRSVKAEFAKPRTRAFIASEDGRPVFREHSVEECAAYAAALEELLGALGASCEVVGGSALLSLPAEQRKALLNVLPPGSADAVAIARARSAALWVDDVGSAVAASSEFGLRRAWTQLVLSQSLHFGKLSRTEYLVAIGKLLTMGYRFTPLSALDMVLLLTQSEWNWRRGIGQAVVGQMIEFGCSCPENCLVIAFALLGVWARHPSERDAVRLILHVLDTIGAERSGPTLARCLYRAGASPWKTEATKLRRLRRRLRRWRCSKR